MKWPWVSRARYDRAVDLRETAERNVQHQHAALMEALDTTSALRSELDHKDRQLREFEDALDRSGEAADVVRGELERERGAAAYLREQNRELLQNIIAMKREGFVLPEQFEGEDVPDEDPLPKRVQEALSARYTPGSAEYVENEAMARRLLSGEDAPDEDTVANVILRGADLALFG